MKSSQGNRARRGVSVWWPLGPHDACEFLVFVGEQFVQVVGGDDAGEGAVRIDDRQASDPVFAHQFGRLVEAGVSVDRTELRRHHVLGGVFVRVATFGEHAHREIAIGDDPDRLRTVGDHDAADARVVHRGCEFLDRRLRCRRHDVAPGEVFDWHWRSGTSHHEDRHSSVLVRLGGIVTESDANIEGLPIELYG